MAALLTRLRPGGAPAIHELPLSSFTVSPAGVADCATLAAVTHLEACEAAADDWDAALGALLRQAPLLSSLRVQRCFPGGLPQCLVECTGLRSLTTAGNGLQALPAGPYLASLEQLCLAEDSVVVLPAALTAATALTSLEVQHEIFTGAAPLAADSLAPVLRRLSRLRQLQLTSCGLPALPVDDWVGVSALQSLSLRDNAFTCLPAALSQAASLTQLDLSRNQYLAATAQQLGALLSRLPLLEQLNLHNTGLTELPEHFPPGKSRWAGIVMAS